MMIGIVGGSGAGKSSLADAVAELLGPRRAVRLSQDAYYRDLSHLPPERRARENFDSPSAIETELLAAHLAALRRGESVAVPEYDMTTHVRTGRTRLLAPAEIGLVEGTVLLADELVAEAIDALVYVDLSDEERLSRRIARDVAERGRSEESVRAQWRDTVLPMHRAHVEPARAGADLVVSGLEPPERNARTVIRVLRL